MSLVKIRTPGIRSTLDKPFKVQFQKELVIEPNSTVELINFSCRLDRDVYVNPNPGMYITVVNRNTGAIYNIVNVLTYNSMTRRSFLQNVQDALNTAHANLNFIVTVLPGISNEVVQIYWESIGAVATYNLALRFTENYTILGYPTAEIYDDSFGDVYASNMTAPNPMILSLSFPKNLTIELLNTTLNSFDSVSHQNDPIVAFIPSVDWTLNDDNRYPLVRYEPANTIRIKLNNEYQIKVNELLVRIMTDYESTVTGIVRKEYARIKTFAAMTLSFKAPGEL